jgi:hypothetical protein
MVNLLTASGKGESPQSGGVLAVRNVCVRMMPREWREYPTACSRNYEHREESVLYQHNVTPVFTGKHAIFELTQPLNTAS